MNDQQPYDTENRLTGPVSVLDFADAGRPTAVESDRAVTEAAPAKAASNRPAWVLPVAIGAVGALLAGILGGLLFVNTGQRDVARHQLAATSATLATTRASLSDTQSQLAAAQSDAAVKAATAAYVAMYVRDAAKVNTDSANAMVSCGDSFNYGECRVTVQQTLGDLQAFQADRSAAAVPNPLASSDGQLKDGLSAGIAGIQEVIGGMDSSKADQVKDGWNKFDAAMVAISKAEIALAAGLK